MTAKLPWYRRSVRAQAALLFVLACLLYANTLGHDYVLDDAIVITENTVVQRGVAGWPALFSHDTFYGFFGEQDRAALVAGGRYRPLTPAMFALEQQLAQGPFLHHLLNVLWYAVLVVVILGFVRELTFGHDLPWWVPLGTAALFAAHPLHTEAVANIKGRDEIIALLGAVAAAWTVLWAQRRRISWGGVAGGGLFLLGCLAKENAITFAAVIPLCLYAFRGGGLRYAAPVLVAAAAFLLLRGSVIGWDLGTPSLELMNNPFLRREGGQLVPISWWQRLPTVGYTLLLYLKLLFVPTGLVHDYYPASVALRGWSDGVAVAGLVTHLALLAWGCYYLRSRKMVATGVLVYLLTLSVVSNVPFSVGTLMSERFLFMPSLGFALVVTGGLALRPKLGWILLPVVLVFAVLTVVRNPVWRDNYTLFTTDLPRQPNSAKLLNAASGARLDRYQRLDEPGRKRNQQLLTTALNDLNRALQIHPTYANAYLLRGNAQLLRDEYAAAIADYDRALTTGMGAATVHPNLTLALQRAARQAGEERQDLRAAKQYLLRAEQLAPNEYETLRLLGITSGMGGEVAAARDYFRRALALQPDNEGARENYEMALRLYEQSAAAQ